MSENKLSWLNTVKRILKGDFELTHNEFIKKDGTVIDDHPLKTRLLVLRITGHDQSKNDIRQNGSSWYLLVDKTSKELIDKKDGPMLQGYDEITKKRCLIILCSDGGETT